MGAIAARRREDVAATAGAPLSYREWRDPNTVCVRVCVCGCIFFVCVYVSVFVCSPPLLSPYVIRHPASDSRLPPSVGPFFRYSFPPPSQVECECLLALPSHPSL